MSTDPAAPAFPPVMRTCAPIAFQSVTLSALTAGVSESSTSEISTADVQAASFAVRFSLIDIDMRFSCLQIRISRSLAEGFHAQEFERRKLASPQPLRYSSSIY